MVNDQENKESRVVQMISKDTKAQIEDIWKYRPLNCATKKARWKLVDLVVIPDGGYHGYGK
jgi:hypothetical protein